MAFDVKRLFVLGVLVALIMPFISGVIPAIYTIPVLKVTIGNALSAGLAVFAAEWVGKAIKLL